MIGALRFFNVRMWAQRYWPKVGAQILEATPRTAVDAVSILATAVDAFAVGATAVSAVSFGSTPVDAVSRT